MSLCPACGAELPAAFPGASVVCTCGRRAEVGGARPSAIPSAIPSAVPSASGPYRSASSSHVPPGAAPCPYCGNECPPLVRICPHCDVRLDSVRCQKCFSLQPPGAFECVRCRRSLDLEPLLDATDAPCPRCKHPLESLPGVGARVHECPRCGGIFVPRDTLAEILCDAEVSGALPPDGSTRRPLDTGAVRYLPCPLCHASMNRVNFGKVSGVIVDVCKAHGTWFDAGELTRVVAFAGAGGLEKTRERENEEKQSAKALSQEARVQFAVFAAKERMEDRLDAWRDFLNAIFFW